MQIGRESDKALSLTMRDEKRKLCFRENLGKKSNWMEWKINQVSTNLWIPSASTAHTSTITRHFMVTPEITTSGGYTLAWVRTDLIYCTKHTYVHTWMQAGVIWVRVSVCSHPLSDLRRWLSASFSPDSTFSIQCAGKPLLPCTDSSANQTLLLVYWTLREITRLDKIQGSIITNQTHWYIFSLTVALWVQRCQKYFFCWEFLLCFKIFKWASWVPGNEQCSFSQ